MISGLNTDVEYQGKVYHVQTEDAGGANPAIVTLVFYGGAILAKHQSSYANLLNSGDLRSAVKDLMTAQHRLMIEDLKSGRLFKAAQAAASEAGARTAAPASSKKAAESKNLDDLILDYLSAKEEKEK